MAGSALFPLATSEPVSAQESQMNVQEISGMAHSDIQRLLRDLDDDRFIVREKASSELAEKATHWIKLYGQKLVWKKWVEPHEYHSLEVHKRLERILGIIAQEERQLLWLPTRIKTPKEWWNDESPVALSTITQLVKEQTGTEIVVTLPKGTSEPKIPRAIDGLSIWQITERIQENAGKQLMISQEELGKITIFPPSLSSLYIQYASDKAVQGEIWQSQLEEKKGHTTFGLLLRSEHKIPFGHWRITTITAQTEDGKEIPVSPSCHEGVRPDMPYIHIPMVDAVKRFDLTLTLALTGYTIKHFTHKDFSHDKEVYATDLCAVMLKKISEHEGTWYIGGTHTHTKAILPCTHYDAYGENGEKIVPYGAWTNTDTSPFQLVLPQKPHFLTVKIPEYEVPHTVTLQFLDVPLKKGF